MNKLKVIYVLVALFVFSSASAQVTDTIQVGFYKSVYLIFSDAPELIDAGSEHLSVRTNGNKVILQILDADAWEQSSLFVENNGIAYYYIIDYNDNLTKFIYDYSGSVKSSFKESLVSEKTPEVIKDPVPSGSHLLPSYYTSKNDSLEKIRKDSLMMLNCIQILNSPDRIGNRGVVKYKFGYYLRDMVIINDQVYLKIEVNNRSNISFRRDLEMFKVINVKRRVKGTSEQIVQLTPIYEYNEKPVVSGKEQFYYIVVVDKFVLIKDKKLNIQLWEVNGSDLNEEGGRKMVFDVFYSDIIKMGVL